MGLENGGKYVENELVCTCSLSTTRTWDIPFNVAITKYSWWELSKDKSWDIVNDSVVWHYL